MDDKKRISVTIGGELLTLIASESEEYIKKLAEYLNHKISEISRTSSAAGMASQTKTQLILINIADDYYKELTRNANAKSDLSTAQAKLSDNAREISKLKSENDALKKKLADLEKQLTTSKKELAEYIEAFDSQEKK